MKRKSIGVVVGGIVFAFASAAYSQQSVELKVSVYTPPANPLNIMMESVKKEIAAKSNNRLALNIFHASQLGPAPRQYDMVRTGTADIALVLHGLMPGRFPLSSLAELPAVAGGYSAAMAMFELAGDLRSEYPEVKLLNVLVTPNPPIISRAEIGSLAAIKGKRVRHSGSIQSSTLVALGAVPVLVQPFDLSEALSRGQVDGAVFGYGGITSFKLQDVAKFTFEVPVGAITFAAVMNPAAYEKLPPDLKTIFDEHFGAKGQEAWGRLLERVEIENRPAVLATGVKASSLSAEDRVTFEKVSRQVWDDTLSDLKKKGIDAGTYFEKFRTTAAKYKY